MAMNVSFGGATIYKPGAYSQVSIDLGGGFPLGPIGLVGIIGEASSGPAGSEEPQLNRNFFTPDQITEIRAKYKSGPLVDACNFLFAPAADGAIPSGAQAIYIYKTNVSAKAQIVLGNLYGTIKAFESGIGGNRITYKNVVTPEVSARVTSSAAFDPANLVPADTFGLRIDGSKEYIFTIPAGITDKATFMAALVNPSNWSDAGILGLGFELRDANPTGGPNAVMITIVIDDEQSAVPRQTETYGRARTMELRNVSGTALAVANLAAGFKEPASPAKCAMTISQKRDSLVESDSSIGGDVILEARYSNPAALADVGQVVIDETSVKLVVGLNSVTFLKANYSTLKELVDEMSLQLHWAFSIPSTLFNQLPISALDMVTASGNSSDAAFMPIQIKKDFYEVSAFFGESTIAELVPSTALAGMPYAQAEVALTGGTLGSSSDASIAAGLSAFEAIRLNSVIPLFSRDASADILDSLTDAGSDYTIEAIHQNLKNHLSMMATVKTKSERQGYPSFKASWSDCMDKSAALAFFRMQLCIQDIRATNAQGSIQWFQPWAQACILAGARCGCPVGTPMTFKYMNISGLRHTAQPMRTADANIVNDFNPRKQYDQAIQSGITFLESPQTGGYRWVVDNTTYGKDGNWVYNRGNVIYAADVLAFDFRRQLEDIYVGVKNNVKASEVKSVCESILATYLSQGITVATSDAPQGFKGLTVTINGNTINIDVVVKLVEGIDFVLANIKLQRASSQA